MMTNVYIDGFNLYYRCVKGTPYKWLNLLTLCQLTFPNYSITRIRYFTARIKPRPEDPQQSHRQAVYIRALHTIPILSVHYGHFIRHEVDLPLAHPPLQGPRTARVLKTEEKGSDVNLATYLLTDGYEHYYDVAVVVSNDSDLVEPVRVIRDKLKKIVVILNPESKNNRTAWALMRAATYYRRIRKGVLRNSQFPDVLRDEHGVFSKPAEW